MKSPVASQSGREAVQLVRIPPSGVSLEEIERTALVEALKMSNWVRRTWPSCSRSARA